MDKRDTTEAPRRTVRPSMRGENPSTGPERRQHRRRTVRCECWLDREHTSLYSAEADVAPGRLFFRTGVPMLPGERVRVSLNFADGSAPVIARGVVTEIIEAARGQRNGIGVSLSEIIEGDEEFARLVPS